VLTIHKLTKTLGGRTLLRETGMTINWGERVALVGVERQLKLHVDDN
jgi:ATP-binding cassette subfamily F protein 3